MDILGFVRSWADWVPLATILNGIAIIVVGVLAFRRTDVREHHR